MLVLLGTAYFAGALALGLVYLGACFGFARSRSMPGARRLMLVSVVYFPALLLVMLLDRVLS